MERRALPAAPDVVADPALAATHADDSVRSGLSPAARSAAQTISAVVTLGYASVTGETPETEIRADLETAASLEDPNRYDEGPLLGVGGMGEVHLLRDGRIGRAVARKTLRAGTDSPRAVARFLREARVQGQLEHPSIVPVYDLGTDELGRPYFTMKRVRGETLAHVLDRLATDDGIYLARFPRRRLLAAFVQVCMAIAYAHGRGVIHRDLKPGNIMLGDLGQVYVLDWGLAKLESETSAEGPASEQAQPIAPAGNMTREGDVVGTPMYMPPEQLAAAALDARADVFSLGAILFEILALSPLRSGDSMDKILASAARAGNERASSRRKDVPPELDELCARATAHVASERVASALELAEAVERYLEGDRDLAAKRAQSTQLLAAARARLDRGDRGAEARVAAMKDALKAIALVPDDTEAQKLLLSLVVDGSGALPGPAEDEFAEGDVKLRAAGMKLGLYGYVSWLFALPIAMWAGIRSWTIPIMLVSMTSLCIAFGAYILKKGARSRRDSIILAAMSASIVALSSAWLGPFVLTPLAACATAVMFVMHCTRSERPWLLGVWMVAPLLPFAFELLVSTAPAYSFHGGDLVLHARAIALPAGPTLAALAYTSITFLGLLCIFVGRLRDEQRQAERRLFVQAWHLRQLFPQS